MNNDDLDETSLITLHNADDLAPLKWTIRDQTLKDSLNHHPENLPVSLTHRTKRKPRRTNLRSVVIDARGHAVSLIHTY